MCAVAAVVLQYFENKNILFLKFYTKTNKTMNFGFIQISDNIVSAFIEVKNEFIEVDLFS